ncbi:hypothetical protein LOZ61_000534 [Ophidiomyces ophidiicola]|uniref:Uncharacterized protein n=1 Tax=Ophidiomyces ophidiicola TaxID=1387563 RepID=A0ACB8USH0_9EURO|nr:hypothetical protein LOZ61_000534 [Ophidiomyces ophidiicola]KAI1921577.1 hypothetical protein LOZ60_006127 [Ophidiomyces ophidiicola]KAI1962694.1 hypothetical protein LOZ59_002030 [Ophidiomyces ophidiicola]KAI2123945.1 hypothetical protein LOZ31_004409 [Ophidiomyces ophidiicola]KAI2135440.1 hypothetical protein LOZ27_006500 [Ophidiomyces ophidiicola]
MTAKDTMKAVVFKGPHAVAVEDRPIPKIQDPNDIIVKVTYTALCGSELHVYRGHQPSDTDFIMGHEYTGIVQEVGSEVKTVKPGDKIVSPFTSSCGKCFYCKQGFSSRCEKSQLLGSKSLDGGQAAYVRMPHADGTVMKAPEGINDHALVLMADIFPTGYFAASNGFKEFTKEQISELTVVVIGCGPVGLCALINAEEYKPKHLLAVDAVPDRLELAKSLGAEPWNYKTDREGLNRRVRELTSNRGADVVIEVVGLSPALRMGFELLRPWGTISSVGVHNGEIPWTGSEAYGKNLKIQMGRCPVRSIFPQALDMLKKKQHLLGFMADKIMPLSQAVEGYRIFDNMQAQKVIFDAAQ